MSRYVIIGGSAGGIGAVEAIGEVDPDGTVTVISEEPCGAYSRAMIADYLSGLATLGKMKYRDDHFWKKNGLKALTGEKAVRLNFTARYVELEGGDKIKFDKLLIATGGKPFVPKIEGTEKEGVFTFIDLSNARGLAEGLERIREAVVIGGGLIGISVAEALVKRGVKVTIVEVKDRILNFTLDADASEIVEKAVRKAGVTVLTGQTVRRILGRRDDDESAVGGVVLTDGTEIPCDAVVIAIGVVPRTELVIGTNLKVNRGIVVDRFMRTNIPNVYACGDVAEAYDFVLDSNRLLPLWPVAHLGGRVAGYNMAGRKTEYPGGTVMSALKYFDVPVISVGIVSEEGNGYEVLVDHQPERNLYKKIVLRDDMIVGMILVSDIEKAGIIFHLMKNRVDVREFKQRLISESFGLASLPASVRRKMFFMGD